jgi:hypothetical protein
MPNLTFLTVDERRYRPFDNVLFGNKSEYHFVTLLGEANPVLRRIGIRYLWSSMEDERADRTIIWTSADPASPVVLHGPRDLNGLPYLWTPSPHLRSRWKFWYEAFGEPQRILEEMKRRWKSPMPTGAMPNLHQLQDFLRLRQDGPTLSAE